MEEDFRLFQLVKRNPINSCRDLSKNMIGKRNGIFYFTESFRIDFEKRMYEISRVKDTIKQIRDKAECMDYYCLNDVIDDLNKLLGDDK